MRKSGDDPLGEEDSEKLSKAELDSVLLQGAAEAAGIIHGAIEVFSQEFALIIQRYFKLKEWKNCHRRRFPSEPHRRACYRPHYGHSEGAEYRRGAYSIRNHPDEAGLLGAVHLAPIRMSKTFDALLAVDIGGTNIRAGVVQLNLKKSNTLAKAKVWNTHSGDTAIKTT